MPYCSTKITETIDQIQPPYLPRPDLEALSIAYRRIPILAIGGDVYCDTRIILEALETRFPESPLSLKTAEEKGIRKLFENYMIDGGVFWRAVTLLPVEREAFLQDPKFQEDRSEMIGAPFDSNGIVQARPEGIAHMRIVFQLLESTFLSDGRKWILGNGDIPSLVDIDAVFPLQWIIHEKLMQNAIPDEQISEKQFPKTFAWISRFLGTVAEAEKKSPKPASVDGKGAEKIIKSGLAGPFDTEIDDKEPIDVKLGEVVTVCPTDNAVSHIDKGVLLRLTNQEICIVNDQKIRLHFPRWNFRVGSTATGQSDEQAPKANWTLIYHPMSPFSRKAYILARELKLDGNIDLDQVVVAPVHYPGWSDDNERVGKKNPLAKLPTLVVNGQGIFDSKLIVQYFEEKAETKPKESTDEQQKWRLRTLQHCADGILDSQALIVYENKLRQENGVLYQPWIDGQNEKISRGLD